MSKPPLGARKDDTWYAIGIEPSITKTPVGPVQVPVPYQVISDLSQAMGTSTNVQLNGQPAYLLDQSKMPMCKGDEQGTSGGSRSGTTSLEVKPVSGSGSVKMNGKPIVRAGDKCTLNKENCRGIFIKTSPPRQGTSGSKAVRIDIIPSQKTACPDGAVELKARITPRGTPIQWTVSAPYELVDEKGNPVSNNVEIAFVRVKDVYENQLTELAAPKEPVAISIKTTSGESQASAFIALPVHQNVAGLEPIKAEKDNPAKAVLFTVQNGLFLGSEVLKASSLQVVLKSAQFSRGMYQYVKAHEADIRQAASKFYRDFKAKEQIFQSLSTELANNVSRIIAEDKLLVGRKLAATRQAVRDKEAQLRKNARTLAHNINNYVIESKSHLDASRVSAVHIFNTFDLMLRMMFGRIAFGLDGDSKGFMANGITFDQGPYNFKYGDDVRDRDDRALVTVPGMHWEYHNTRDMELSCNYSFGVNHSVRIRNYTSRYWPASILGDIVQSVCYELVGAIDPHAMAVATAISEGIERRGKVYVVAHSQGSEITRKGLQFIKFMENIPPNVRSMIFKTTLFHDAFELLVAHAFPNAYFLCRNKIPSNPLEGAGIDADDVVKVGTLDAKKRSLIHYQGFGSETCIDRDTYNLGSSRNTKAPYDPIPLIGDMAKGISASLGFAAGANPAGLVLGAATMEHNKEFLKGEKWDVVESPVQFHAKCLLKDPFFRHLWLTNYWPHLQMPVGKDEPTEKIPSLLEKEFNKDLQAGNVTLGTCSNTSSPTGFTCLAPNPFYSAKTNRPLNKQEVVIALFFDGAGNSRHCGSNLDLMINNIRMFGVENQNINRPIVRAAYYDAPEFGRVRGLSGYSDFAIGQKASSNLQDAFEFIKTQCHIFGSENYMIPKIDLFGYGRGAATASELAWKLKSERIPYGKKEIKLNVRFLGLFDMVHNMKIFASRNSNSSSVHRALELVQEGFGIENSANRLCSEWHIDELSPNVEKAFHALAGQESRLCFKPSILNARAELLQMVFPGIHQDVGGNKLYDRERDHFSIMSLSRYWMVKRAFQGGVTYLNGAKIDDAKYLAILNNPIYCKPSAIGWVDEDTTGDEGREFGDDVDWLIPKSKLTSPLEV